MLKKRFPVGQTAADSEKRADDTHLLKQLVNLGEVKSDLERKKKLIKTVRKLQVSPGKVIPNIPPNSKYKLYWQTCTKTHQTGVLTTESKYYQNEDFNKHVQNHLRENAERWQAHRNICQQTIAIPKADKESQRIATRKKRKNEPYWFAAIA